MPCWSSQNIRFNDAGYKDIRLSASHQIHISGKLALIVILGVVIKVRRC
jgi:hypothetical protein